MAKKPKEEKVEVQCQLCKTKFDIWVRESSFNPDTAEAIENHFYHHCPVCKITKKK